MSPTDIGRAISAAREYLDEHPDAARSTDTAATAVIDGGLRCRVTGPNDWVAASDMSPGVGGEGRAPSPGWLLRAALASCDATLIAMEAAEAGIELSRLEVVVDSESDDRGLLGMDDGIPAGPLRTRVRITVAAEGVAADTLRDLVASARRHSPVDDALQRTVPVSVDVQVAG
jgi:uncharacterized OsmC-like protein